MIATALPARSLSSPRLTRRTMRSPACRETPVAWLCGRDSFRGIEASRFACRVESGFVNAGRRHRPDSSAEPAGDRVEKCSISATRRRGRPCSAVAGVAPGDASGCRTAAGCASPAAGRTPATGRRSLRRRRPGRAGRRWISLQVLLAGGDHREQGVRDQSSAGSSAARRIQRRARCSSSPASPFPGCPQPLGCPNEVDAS